MSFVENLIDNGYFVDLKSHVAYNYQISEFYENFYADTGDDVYMNKSKNVDLCCRYWDTDYYKFQNVKDIKRVNLCRDKFCFNCQSMLAIKRQGKFAPILNQLREKYKVCHIVFTVPNCLGENLKKTLNQMYSKFPNMMKYFKCQNKVKGVNFAQYGYGGAVRGLEVTYNDSEKTFHPHFHCMVLLDESLDLTPRYKNSYSFNYGRLVREFSDFEILLQKIWYLLINDIKVTAAAIKNLKEGYSVTVEDSKGYYHECFKYAIKGAFDPAQGACIYKEHIFRTLYSALNKRRMIQGYGKLYNFNDLDGEILEEEVIAEYEKQIALLRGVEKPELCIESLDEIIERSKHCKYISKSNLKRLIIERMKEEVNGIETKG